MPLMVWQSKSSFILFTTEYSTVSQCFICFSSSHLALLSHHWILYFLHFQSFIWTFPGVTVSPVICSIQLYTLANPKKIFSKKSGEQGRTLVFHANVWVCQKFLFCFVKTENAIESWDNEILGEVLANQSREHHPSFVTQHQHHHVLLILISWSLFKTLRISDGLVDQSMTQEKSLTLVHLRILIQNFAIQEGMCCPEKTK